MLQRKYLVNLTQDQVKTKLSKESDDEILNIKLSLISFIEIIWEQSYHKNARRFHLNVSMLFYQNRIMHCYKNFFLIFKKLKNN